MVKSLENVLNPRSVAVIGASEIPGKAAERRTRSLLESKFDGEIYLINPKRSEIFGRPAYANIRDVGKDVDLVMVIVPPAAVLPAVQESVQVGARGVIIITAGLGATGENRREIELEILNEASRAGTCIIGPNCSGLFSASGGLNLLGLPNLEEGPISVLAQSGNVIDSLTHYARIRNLGFSKIISLGNAIDLSFVDCLDHLSDDPETRVILAYLEGIKDGSGHVRRSGCTSLYRQR